MYFWCFIACLGSPQENPQNVPSHPPGKIPTDASDQKVHCHCHFRVVQLSPLFVLQRLLSNLTYQPMEIGLIRELRENLWIAKIWSFSFFLSFAHLFCMTMVAYLYLAL